MTYDAASFLKLMWSKWVMPNPHVIHEHPEVGGINVSVEEYPTDSEAE